MTLDQFISQRGMTEVQFAALTGHSQPFINRLRRGIATPSLDTIRKIEAATGGAVSAGEWCRSEAAA